MRMRPVVFAILLLAGALPAAAQPMNAVAFVPVASPTGTGTRNLTFGVIAPVSGQTQNVNVVAAVAPMSATVQSGEFRFNVAGMRGVDFDVTVPTQLTAPGATPLAVTFNGTQYGGYCVTTAATCSLTAFNPAAAGNVRVCRQLLLFFCNPFLAWPSGSTMRVYVGGRLTVPPTARAGVYTGTITLTIVQVH